jgi:hypothetical protein
VTKTLAQGRRILDEIFGTIEDSQGLVDAYARGVLQEASLRAASRPTPQAPMASAAMGIEGTHITVLTGGTPEAVSGGSEWGSDIYPQFGPRNQSGWWLMPSTDSAAALNAGDAYLEQIMDKAIRGF